MASGILSNSLKRALLLIKLEEGGDHKRWGNVAFHCPILFHRVERCLFIYYLCSLLDQTQYQV